MPRRPKYREEFAEQARKLCMLGATNPELGDFFGVSKTSIDNWIAQKPEFAAAVHAGRDIADAEVVESLYHQALAGNVTACIYWLKNRRSRDWRDRHEHTGAGGGPLEFLVSYDEGPPEDDSEGGD